MTRLRTGTAPVITLGLFYALCALVWVAAPGPSLSFMNGLFHGMEFGGMVQPRPFAWPGFLVALVVLSAWGVLHRSVLHRGVLRLGVQPPGALIGRLAITEADMRNRFGAGFEAYAARTPRFLPSRRAATSAPI